MQEFKRVTGFDFGWLSCFIPGLLAFGVLLVAMMVGALIDLFI